MTHFPPHPNCRAVKPDSILLNNDDFFAEVAKQLEEGHSVSLWAKGNSMYPFIASGRDSVTLHKQRQFCTGNIVLARIPGKGYVLHRIYRIQGDTVVLMGDGNLRATEQCRKEDILGTVLKIMRNGRIVCPASATERRKAWLWRILLPLRRYMLAVCRWKELWNM